MINNTVAPNPDYTEHHVEAGKRIYHIAILKRTMHSERFRESKEKIR